MAPRAIGISRDPSLAWSKACDDVRSQIVGLPANAGCFIYPSIESALTEIGLMLTERERELGGTRTSIVYGAKQDPALDRMAKMLSGAGLDTQAKSEAELRDVTSWFAEVKPKALLFAFAEDDRFTGRVYDVGALRSALFAEGLRIPVLSINSGSQAWRSTLPRPFETRVYDLPVATEGSAGEFATLVIAGERLRFEPRLAPLAFDETRLSRIESAWVETRLDTHVASLETPEAQLAHALKARTEIEAFEAALPSPFRAWWPKASARMLDRAVVTSADHDGSWVIERLRERLVAQGVSVKLLDSGLFSLSGCAMEDERRQEWLRSRGDDAWLLRGANHISLDLIRAVSIQAWLKAFSL